MSSLYPDIPVQANAAAGSSQITYGRELAFDFSTGDFIMIDGAPKAVEGVTALKIWIEKAIRTARYRFPIYSFQYGCELEDIIGLDIPSPVLESEVQRVIREALIYDNRIKDVINFIFERGCDWLKVEFTVITFDDNSFSLGVSV